MGEENRKRLIKRDVRKKAQKGIFSREKLQSLKAKVGKVTRSKGRPQQRKFPKQNPEMHGSVLMRHVGKK